MKFNNKILILTIVLLALISLSAVSAADDAGSSDDASDILSVSQDETTQLTSDNYNKTVYVDSQGDDSGAGTEKSPYASLNKAISSVDASDNAVIYMGAGIYSGENNTDLNINLAHKNYKGSLTIAGAGIGKTIIDANLESPIFTSISADSIVILKDITFINGKNRLGSAISNSGDLTIDTCAFENNSAQTYATVYHDDPNNLKVVNSVFRDNTAGYANADIYAYMSESSGYNVTLINSSFYNAESSSGDSASVDIQATNVLVQGNTFTNISSSSKSSLYVRSPNGKIINNVFKDCSYTGSSGAILYIAGTGVYLEGNKFENYTSSSNVPLYALMNFNANLAFNNITVDGTSFKLTCNVTDDMGNPVSSYYKVQFYFDGKKVGEASANGGVATLSLSKLLENGTYDLTGYYGDDNPLECKVVDGTVTVDFDHNPTELWVSATGNDTAGDGSKNNPFLTIKHAIDYAIDDDSVEITVHVKEGIYNISGDYGLSYSDVVDIAIIGETYGKVIIDGNNANGFLTSGLYTNVFLQNLTFVNGTGQYSRSFNVRYLTMKDCIVNNIGQLYAQNSPSQVIFDNVIWTNTKQFATYNAEIYNSHFENITSSGTGNLWLATVSNNDVIVIMNSEFVNMVCSGSSGAGVAYVQGNFVSINNTYASNKATSRGYGALYVSGNKIISINDTFIDNEANTDYGAACFCPNNANATVKVINAEFINNTAGGNGGALGLYGGEIINSTFENNTAGALGGAIYMPTHSSSSVYLYDITLDGVTFDGNAAATNGQDIYVTQTASTSAIQSNLNGMAVSMNDLKTTTLQDFVSANVTHESGAIVGGGVVTFYLNGSYMGVANVVDGVATLDYLGFKTNGTFTLSGEYNLATNDTVYNNATVVVALAPLKDNVTLYVSDSLGDDVNGTGSLDKPYKTIKTALTNGYKQSAVIVVRVLEGNYSGELNNNLTVASSLDISIIGDGQGVTIIDGQDVSWFFKILAGDGIIRIENMTVANVTKNYVDAKQYNQMPALTIENGAVVFVDGVEFVRCHGTEGGAILNEGTLTVINSRFFNNGDSSNGAAIKNYGTAIIDNSEFIANHAKYFSTIYNDGQLFISNSLIQDAMRVNGWTGNAIAVGGKGNATFYNSTISRSGKTSAELIGTGQTWANNPGFVIGVVSTSGTVKVIDCVIDGNNKAYSASYVSNYAFGGTSGVPLNVEVVNTKIVNVLGLVMNSKGNNLFDSCYIENVTNAHYSTSYDFNLTVVNSYFADGTTVVQKKATANVDLNNNWWGTNDKPTYKVSNVDTSPDTWLILTLNSTDEPGLLQEVILEFKVTDGENVTDYMGSLYPREFNISVVNGTLGITNGSIDSVVVSQFKGIDGASYYIEATVDGQTLNITKKVEIGQSEISAEDIELMVGENKFDVIVLVNNASASNFNINLTVNKKNYTVPVINGVASFEIEELPYGNYTLDYVIADNDVCYGTVNSANLTVLRYDPAISMVSNVTDEVIIILTGNYGAPLANVNVSYSVDGKKLVNTTDDNGQIIISGVKGIVDIVASYDGDDIYNPITVEKNVTVYNGRKETVISIIGVDGNLNVVGLLCDFDSNPIANATIQYAVGNNIANVTTDEKGTFTVLADNDLIVFYFAETFDYEAGDTYISLKDIAPVRQATEIEITLGDIKVKGDVAVNISVSNVTGELSIYVDDNDVEVIPVIDGKANYTIASVDAGSHNIVVAYLGDLYNEAAVSSKFFNVEKLASEITLNVADAKIGEIVTFAVNVTEGAKGVVVISVGVLNCAIDLNETNVLELLATEVGVYNVTAIYYGDDIYNPAVAQATVNITDKESPAIIVDIPAIVDGENATITISVPNATGAVKVFLDDDESEIIPLDENGTVTYTITDAVAGSHSIAVLYSGDAENKGVLVSKAFDVAKKPVDANITLPVDFKIGEEANVTVDIPGATGNVSVIVDGVETVVALDENGTAVVPINITPGEHGIVVAYSGDDSHAPVIKSTTLNAPLFDSKFINLTVSGDMVITGVLIDSLGDAIANATITYAVGNASGNVTTADDGSFTIVGASNSLVSIAYAGTDDIVGSDITINFGDIAPAREATVILGANYTQYAIEYSAGERGQNFTVQLVDANGKPLANKTVLIGYNGKTLERTTDENGFAYVQINLKDANRLTFAATFLGDENYNATMSVYLITINKKPVTISASAKSYKASASTKKYTVTLKTEKCSSADGKIYFAEGKKVTLKINGKTYTAKTNKDGKATFSLKITKKGKFAASIKYAGDTTYEAASKSVKITIN